MTVDPTPQTVPTGASPASTDRRDEPLMSFLAGHLPISLIMDLAMPAGPHSDELLRMEYGPDAPWPESR
ncbi:MAG: hypothetical protein GXX79_06590 [Actinomycetales bacterium]|nr:hypothetical protein [Actinomycetales bacterium]